MEGGRRSYILGQNDLIIQLLSAVWGPRMDSGIRKEQEGRNLKFK